MTKKKLLLEHLNNLGINKNDNILIYSKLSSFGIVDKNFTKLIQNTIPLTQYDLMEKKLELV